MGAFTLVPQTELLRFLSLNRMEFTKTHTTGIMNVFRRHCIGYILAGSVKILQAGRELNAEAGDLIYISQESRYYSVWSGDPQIIFDSVSFDFTNRRAHAGLGLQIVHDFPRENFDRMWEAKGDMLKILSAFYSVLDRLYGSCLQPPHTAAKHVIPAVYYIDTHYRETISVPKLASLCCMSVSHFHAVFQREVGTTPIRYHHSILVQEAIRLLLETDLSIEAISEELGFSSSCYFRRVFSAITNKSPHEIRC